MTTINHGESTEPGRFEEPIHQEPLFDADAGPTTETVAAAGQNSIVEVTLPEETPVIEQPKKSKKGVVIAVSGGVAAVAAVVGSFFAGQQSGTEEQQTVAPAAPSESATPGVTEPTAESNPPADAEEPLPTGAIVSFPDQNRDFDSLDTFTIGEVDATLAESNLTASQQEMLRYLAVESFYPVVQSLNYDVEHFKDRGLTEEEAHYAVYCQLIYDFLAAMNNKDPDMVLSMFGPNQPDDVDGARYLFARFDSAFLIPWFSAWEGAEPVTVTQNGTQITYSGSLPLIGFDNTERLDDEGVQTYLTPQDYNGYLLSTGSAVGTDISFTVDTDTNFLASYSLEFRTGGG